MNAEGLLAHYARIVDAPDAIARLRRFVLDLAVRGKLVEQNDGDECASDLLTRISAEKTRQVVAKRLKKGQALSPIEAPPFAIPNSWLWTRIRDIASDRGQKVPDGPFTYVDVTAIDKQRGTLTEPKVLEANEAPSRARKVIRKGDVIYSCVRPYLLNVAIIEGDFDPSPIASTAFAVLDGHGLVLPRFIWIVLRSPFMVERVESNMRGQAYPAINDADFAALPFLLPPLAEQHRIVAKVDELMALCDRLETARDQREATRDRLAAASLARLNTPDPETFPADAHFALDALPALTTRPDQIKQLRQTILNLAVRGKLVAQRPDREQVQQELLRPAKRKSDDRDESRRHTADRATPYELPVNWIWATTEEICAAIVDCPHSTPVFSSQGIPCLDTNSVKSGTVVHAKLRFVSEEVYRDRIRRLTPESGDIIFAREGSVGESAVVPEGMRCCMGQRVMLFRPSDLVAPKYFQLAISEPSSLERLLERHKGIGARHVNVSDMRQALLPVPPIAEQHRIVAKVAKLTALCDQLEASLTTGETTRSRLLDALLHEALAPTPTMSIEHSRAAVSGYVVSRLASRRNFGRTAHMKHLYLAEARLGLNLGGRYVREAAGPLDIGIYALEKQAEATGWYTYNVKRLLSGREKVSYVPGKALKALAEEGIAVLGGSRTEMDRLIELMGSLKTEQVEIIATLFAAWNDALLDGQTPADDWVVKEVREHWHASKQRFTPAELHKWLGWMHQNDVVPLGHPPRTMQQTSLEL